MATFLLYESASGYALFEAGDMDEIGQTQEAVQDTITCVRRPAFSIRALPRRAASRAPRAGIERARAMSSRRASAESIARRRPRSGQTGARRSAPRDPAPRRRPKLLG